MKGLVVMGPFCRCQCKMCRVPGTRHCHAHPSCGAHQLRQERPAPATGTPDERHVTRALQQLRADSGTHSPSVAQIDRAIPGLVKIDACFLANPYATTEVMTRLREIPGAQLDRMVAHYPSQAPVIAAMLAPQLGVPADCLHLANGAAEVIHALLADTPGPVLLSLPTFSAYHEFARGPVVAHQLDHRKAFRVDLDDLAAMVERHAPQTVVIINPNNPDGGLIPRAALVDFLQRVQGRVSQVIVDESFSHFTTEDAPESVAPLVDRMPHLVVVNSLSKSHGIAGLRLGYAVMAAQRVRALRKTCLWNLNAFAEWFCTLLCDPEFGRSYEQARRRYVRDIRGMLTDLDGLPDVTTYPSAANFALVELDRPARDVTGALLARHGVYVRDCADKRGLHGDRFIRVAARSRPENLRIVDGLRAVLEQPVRPSSTFAQPVRRRAS